MSARFTVADLAASGVLDVGRNRERVAQAAGLPHHETIPERPAPVSTAAHPKARELPAAAAGAQTSPSGGPDLRALTLAVLGEERRSPPLTGEDATQADVRFFIDNGTRIGRWLVVFVPFYNEVRVSTASKRQLERNPSLLPWHNTQVDLAGREGARARAMGRRKGCPDGLLLNVGLDVPRFALIEVKYPPNGLSDEQETWRDWCEAAGVNWALATHPTHREDVLRAFRAWGWL